MGVLVPPLIASAPRTTLSLPLLPQLYAPRSLFPCYHNPTHHALPSLATTTLTRPLLLLVGRRVVFARRHSAQAQEHAERAVAEEWIVSTFRHKIGTLLRQHKNHLRIDERNIFREIKPENDPSGLFGCTGETHTGR